jgi:AcrR family transcriptional regulator
VSESEQDARSRIIHATKEILDEAEDIEKITVRQVAQRANVGVGLINYHFQSKDNLLSIAIGDTMAQMVGSFIEADNHPELPPVEKLKALLKELIRYSVNYEKLLRFGITHSIMNGDMQAQLMIIPLLREIFGGGKDEIQLRIIAMQIILPLQAIGISPSAFHMYSGIDLHNEAQMDLMIDMVVDNLI